jgi:hypothetical protein
VSGREPFPANELEASLLAAADTGDHAKLLRSLARNVLCLHQPGPGPPPGTPEIQRYAPGERPLPTMAGRDGRTYALAFTSSSELDRYYDDPELVWSMVPAGVLASEWPAELPLLLNAGGGHGVVLEPEDMRTVALLFAGADVPEAFQPGPATAVRTAVPELDAAEAVALFGPLAARHPEIVSVYYGLLLLDEPEARPWLVVGLRFAPGADHRPIMGEAVAALERETTDFVDLRALVDEPAEGTIERWLLDEGGVLPLAAPA